MQKSPNREYVAHHSDKILRREIDDGMMEYEDKKRERQLSSLVDRVQAVDARHKALTGRRREQYVEESGVSGGELFPENGGDAWAVDMREQSHPVVTVDDDDFIDVLEKGNTTLVIFPPRASDATKKRVFENILTSSDEEQKRAS